MLRSVYTALLYVFAPIALAGTALRGLRDPAYRDRLSERLGFTRAFRHRTGCRPPVDSRGVGGRGAGGRASDPRTLLKKYSAALAADHDSDADRRAARAGIVRRLRCGMPTCPSDLPGAMRRFLDRVRQRLAIVMEREIWPNLFGECKRRRIPILLASARESRSVPRFGIESLLRCLATRCRAMSLWPLRRRRTRSRYRSIGAQQSAGHGQCEIRYRSAAGMLREAGRNIASHAAHESSRLGCRQHSRWRRTAGTGRASNRDIHSYADALLVLVPRHPNRFDAVRAWLKSEQVEFVSRSRNEVGDAGNVRRCYLVDTLGELMTFYAAADIAFVGGSLIATVGGHNLLEPAVLERPILVGPHNFNAPDIAQLMIERGAAREVNSAEQLAAAILDLYAESEARARRWARRRTPSWRRIGAR